MVFTQVSRFLFSEKRLFSFIFTRHYWVSYRLPVLDVDAGGEVCGASTDSMEPTYEAFLHNQNHSITLCYRVFNFSFFAAAAAAKWIDSPASVATVQFQFRLHRWLGTRWVYKNKTSRERGVSMRFVELSRVVAAWTLRAGVGEQSRRETGRSADRRTDPCPPSLRQIRPLFTAVPDTHWHQPRKPSQKQQKKT